MRRICSMNAEEKRLAENDHRAERWHLWGPYLSERQWGTVREDYSANGDAWNYFTHNQARSRAYRWGEDGIGGISDFKQRLCFAFAFWNGNDPILKERLFGLTGPQGNHGEDGKEIFFFEDSTPSHSYMRMTYRYPQAAFPYDELVRQNAATLKDGAGVRALGYERAAGESLFRHHDRVCEGGGGRHSHSRDGDESRARRGEAALAADALVSQHLELGRKTIGARICASGKRIPPRVAVVEASHHALGEYRLLCEGASELLFTENESNLQLLYGVPNPAPFVKDAFHESVVKGNDAAINPERMGTKGGRALSDGSGSGENRSRAAAASADQGSAATAFHDFDEIFAKRRAEADEFHRALTPRCLSAEHAAIQRQALAGMLWTKQFYYYVVEEWLEGDPAQPAPPNERKTGRNSDWRHLYNERVMSMPDSWEYPWYAAWDLAFHCIPLALVDPHFAKGQLDIILREWYQHPNGQIPAYEWNFSDVNPPVIGWAAWRVYKIEQRNRQRRPRFSGNDLPQAAHQFHLVGEPQGFRRPQHFRRRLSRARQHRRLRPERLVSRWQPARAERRHELDGNVLPNDDADRARTGAGESGLRKHRDQVLRAFPRHRRGDEQRGRPGDRSLG